MHDRAPTCCGAIAEHDPDLVVLDLQIGNMGGMAACMASGSRRAPAGSTTCRC